MANDIKDYYCCENGKLGLEKVKILLVYPRVGSEAKNVSLYPPLSLLCLSAYLKDFSVAIFDQRVDDIKRFYSLLDQGPLCVGFSVMTGPQIKFSLDLAQVVKDRNIPTVFGGVHPSILPAQTQKDKRVDYVIAGEGELAFRNLVMSLMDGKRPNPIITSEYVDLDQSPTLPYELIGVDEYVYSSAIEGRALPVLFSRGCPFACTFCCNPVITKRRWRAMDLELATEQLNQLVDRYKLDSIIFWDENLTVNPVIFNRLAHGINGRFKWYAQSRVSALLKYDLDFLERMGLWRLSCGIESGSPRVLKKIKKEESVDEYIEANRGLAKTGISVWYNYIVGFPGEALDDIRLTTELAMQILSENPNAFNSTFYLLAPYPGTEVAQALLTPETTPDSFEKWSDFGRYNFKASWYTPERLKLYERICFSSKFVGRKISKLFPKDKDLQRITSDITNKWKNFDFSNDKEWAELDSMGWKVLRKLFGEHAY